MPDRLVQSEAAVRVGPWQAAVGISGNARRRGSSLYSHLALGRPPQRMRREQFRQAERAAAAIGERERAGAQDGHRVG
jgi:hypothetical protein